MQWSWAVGSPRHFAACGRMRTTKVEHPQACRSSGEHRIMAFTALRGTPSRELLRTVLSAEVPGGRHVGEDLRCSDGVEETRLYRRRQIQGDVRALAQGSERLLGRASQTPALVQSPD